ncbi:hypothetical protein ABIA39_000716 [Nocardia sp. GAS34]
MTIRYLVNYSIIFTEFPILERPAAARAASCSVTLGRPR